MKLNFKTEQLQ